MKKNDIWEVEILAADRFKKRGYKEPSVWFRLDVALIQGKKWNEMSLQARCLWLLILSLGASQGSLRVSLGSTRSVSRDARVKPASVPRVISELSDVGWLRIVKCPSRARNVRTYERTVPDTQKSGSKNQPTIVANATPPIDPSSSKKSGFTNSTWESYRSSYLARYNVDPIRNRKVNGQLANLIGQIGANNAEDLVRFYLSCEDKFYCDRKHPLDFVLKDVQTLMTKFKTGDTGPSAKGWGV